MDEVSLFHQHKHTVDAIDKGKTFSGFSSLLLADAANQNSSSRSSALYLGGHVSDSNFLRHQVAQGITDNFNSPLSNNIVSSLPK